MTWNRLPWTVRWNTAERSVKQLASEVDCKKRGLYMARKTKRNRKEENGFCLVGV